MKKTKRQIKKKYKKMLFCLLTILIVVSNSYFLAKYTSAIHSSSDNSVAIWDVSTDTSDNANNSLNIVSGNTTASYVIKVKSVSEVASKYDIVLTNVPTGLEVKLDSGSYQTPTNNEITFSNVGSFTAGSATTEQTHTITLNDPLSTSNSGTYSMNIDVMFEQVD